MADPDPMTCDPGSRVYDPDPGTVIPDPIYLVTTLLQGNNNNSFIAFRNFALCIGICLMVL